MPTESTIPGIQQGMFFRYFLFVPTSSFTKQDVSYVIKYLDLEFNTIDLVPETALTQFTGKNFTPNGDITFDMVMDILGAAGITISESLFTTLPDKLKEHFVDLVFSPFSDFTLKEFMYFLSIVIQYRLDDNKFNTLPDHIKKHFVIYDRYGSSARWTKQLDA